MAPLPRRFTVWILLLFVGSGCSALIYEVVWFQLLELVVGATAASLGLLLATFMGGLCAGSLLLPRFVPPAQHPLRVYARLELGIAVLGLLVLFGLPVLSNLYVANAGHGSLSMPLRALLAIVCLLPPTVLMGATLPAIARLIESTPSGVSWLGFFYGGNIAGAVVGSLLAGFYLLRVYDMATATYVAVTINVAVAAVAWVLSTRVAAPGRGAEPTPARGVKARATGPRETRRDTHTRGANVYGLRTSVYVAIALSGLAALGAEVIWTRILSLLFGGTVYTFSLIAAAFLCGLGIGSAKGAWLARYSERPGLLLAGFQLGAAVSVAWGAALMNRAYPYWPIDPALAPGPWFNFQIDLVRAFIAIVPAACFWGGSFPLALAAAGTDPDDPARGVGTLYAANTIGAVVGALVFSLLIIPAFGTQDAQRLLIWAALAAAAVMLMWPPPTEARTPAGRRVAMLLGGLVIAGAAAATVAPVPPDVVAYGRQIATFKGASYLYEGEGLNSSIAVSESEGGIRNFHVSGKVEASTEVHDMRLQRMLGHISALMHPEPHSVLIVGFGAGVTAGSFVLHPGIKRIVICEIEPLIPRMVAPFFSKENYDVVHDPRVEIVYDDARHYILTTNEKFDIITSDPIHPWVKGAASLYTKEYFELVKSHLNSGGVVTQWVPLYQSTEDVIKSEVATFSDVFPYGTIWSNQYANGGGYDVVMLAKSGPLQIDPAALEARLNRPDHAAIKDALAQVELGGVDGVMASYAGQARDLRPWLTDAQINTDRNLRLEYLAGLGNNVYDAMIYQHMLAFRRFPEEMFTASPEWMDRLRRVMAVAPGSQ
ncbi:MAG TPA: fused MFS/spermidine synthase [Vicinamibacterales bacterium]|nr:fused MFS/spermidine synthase [Vicinamibacterales bacterium]